jgi:putative ABC transport system permease protein
MPASCYDAAHMKSDLREAFRALAAAPGFTAVVVLTLALAVGVTTTIFSVLHGVLLRPLDYAAPHRLVALFESNRALGQEQAESALATFLDWRAQNRTFENMGAWRYRGFTLTGDGDPERIVSVEATPSTFHTLGVSPVVGRLFSSNEETRGHERLALISFGAWQRRFGGRDDVVGRSLRLDDQTFEIVGVMPEMFRFPADDPKVEVWSPLTFDLSALASRPHRMYKVIGRLAGTSSIDLAREDMARVAARVAADNPTTNAGWGALLIPAHQQVVGNIGGTIWMLFGAVVLVLLIACANIANLLLARSTLTVRDFAVRAAFGAGRWVLVRRSMVETALLASGGIAVGLPLAWWGIATLRTLVPARVPRGTDIGLDTTVLAFTAVVGLGAAVLVGLIPALRAMRPNVVGVLQDTGRGGVPSRRSRRVSNAMVVAEVALALVLVIGAGLLVRSFIRLTAVDPGFRTSGIVAVDLVLPNTRYPKAPPKIAFYDTLLAELRAVPGLDVVGAVSALPMSPLGLDFSLDFTIDGLASTSPTERPRAAYRGVIAGYFEAMGIALREGRTFNAFDGREGGQRVAIVNETLARRYFSGQRALDRVIQMPMAGTLTVVGVVADTRQQGFDEVPRPQVYVPYYQLALTEMQVVLRSGLPAADVASRVRSVLRRIDPDLPIASVSAIEDLLSEAVAQPRFNMALLVGLALSAALLAAVGVYGVVTYSVSRRTVEIGVRMALGADPDRTFREVVLAALRVVLTGVAIGLGAAAVLGRWMESLLFGVSPVDIVTYAMAGLVLVVVGLLAASLPARRAARIDPVKALRE